MYYFLRTFVILKGNLEKEKGNDRTVCRVVLGIYKLQETETRADVGLKEKAY